MKTFDEKAEEYADKVALDKNTYRGDVVTAYVCGAMEALEISDIDLQKMAQELHDNLGGQVRFCEEFIWGIMKLKGKV